MNEFPGMPINAAAHGGSIDLTMWLVHILMAVLFVGWGAFFVYTLVRFRRGRNPKADYRGVKGHFSSWVEGGVVLFEAALLVGFAIPIWAKVKANVPTGAPDAVVVRVVAEQYSWNIHYPGADGTFGKTSIDLVNSGNPLGLDRSDPAAKDDITTINQLHLPVDRPAVIRLSSKDVIHGFFLPEMRVKQDAIPGMVSPVYFTPVRTGEFEIACAQLCGLGHYRMRGYFTVHDQAGFDAWMAGKVKELAEEY